MGCVASSEWTSAVFPLLIAAVKAASMSAGATDNPMSNFAQSAVGNTLQTFFKPGRTTQQPLAPRSSTLQAFGEQLGF